MHTAWDIRIIDFNAIATAVFVDLQVFEHGTVTATQIQYARSGCYPVSNESKVGTQTCKALRNHAASLCTASGRTDNPCQILS